MWKRAALRLIPLALGCATAARFEDDTFFGAHATYRVGRLSNAWQQHGTRGADLAFVNPSGGTIFVNATCTDIKDLSLDVLTNQALFGVEQLRELPREVFTLDGRAALRTRLTGTLDGVPVAMELVVLKKDGCTYDFGLITSPDVFAAREADFSTLVSGFRQLERKG
jgi:hypothetical protein